MRTLLGAAALAAATVLTCAMTAQAATGLQTVPSPNPGTDYNELDGVAAVSPTNAWSVGFQRPSGGTLLFHTLAEHWDGTKWAVAATAPVPAADDTKLHGIALRTATDGWAAGEDSVITGTGATTQSLIEHWNGTSWTRLPSPAGEPVGTILRSISADAADDAWAVGNNGVVEHWNGTSWSLVPGASIASGAPRLLGVTALSKSNAWAVGATANRHSNPVIEHWDGTAWTQVAQPVGGFDSMLRSISAAGPNDIWAVGETNLDQTVTEHWDGTSWTQVPSPSVTVNNAQDTLTGVVALSSTDVWAVGFSLQNFTQNVTLALHWDGTSWQIVPSANPTTGSNTLYGVAGTAPGQPLWAAGYSSAGTTPQFTTLIETTTG